jgi:heme/copper-type cytochrome/quinol oxidase subunit 2
MMEVWAARLIVLEVCAGIVALLFLATPATTASHRARHRAGGAYPASALAEYLWAMVPWVILAEGALPAVRLILAAR